MKIHKCELCDKITTKRITIKNRLNGNELKICQHCMDEYGFKKGKE